MAFRQAVFARPGITVASTGNCRGEGAARRRRVHGLLGDESPEPRRDAGRAGRSRRHGRRRGGRGAEGAGLDGLPESADRPQRAARLGRGRATAGGGAALSRRGARRSCAPWRPTARRRSCSCRAASRWRARRTGGARSAQVGWLVPEAYTPATSLWSIGNPFLISRVIRVGFREWVSRLTGLGIPGLARRPDARVPVGRLAGRPGGAAADGGLARDRQAAVARRASPSRASSALSTVWSWGWGTFATPGSADADKQAAACTYLWARDNALCDAPALAVPGFDPDLTAGAVQLAPTTQCRYAGGSFGTAELTALTTPASRARARSPRCSSAASARARRRSARRRCCAPSAA